MKKIVLPLVFILAGFIATATDNVNSGNLAPFNSVSLSGKIVVELIPAEVSSIDISLADTDMARLKWEVSNGTLSLSLKPGSKNSNGSAEVKIYYADTLRNVSISGGDLLLNETIESDILKLSVSGGGKVSGSIDVFDAEVEVTGNSVAQITGQAKYLSLRATERSKADLREVGAVAVDVDTATGAEVYVNVKERFTVNAKTNSTVFYKGQPRVFKDRSTRLGSMGSSVHFIGQ